MPIDPNAIGAKTKPNIFEWTDRDTLLYALGVGAGTQDLAFTTENSHDTPQQVLPTYAVIACLPFAAAGKIGTFNFAMLLHGSQEIRLHKPLPPAGKLSVVGQELEAGRCPSELKLPVDRKLQPGGGPCRRAQGRAAVNDAGS